MLPVIKGNKMINRALFIWFLLLGLSCNILAANADDDEKVERSNGYSAQGELLIPYDIVKRCNLGDGGALELTDDCLYALACDKHQVFQEWVRNKKGEGKDVSIDEISGGNHENIAKEKAGYEIAPTLGAEGVAMNACSTLKDQCDEAKKDNDGASMQPMPCLMYEKCEESLQQIQAIKDCSDEQGSTRCSIQANNTLTADSTQILSDIVHTKSMMNRNEITKNIVNIIDKMEIDKEKCLNDIKKSAEAGTKGESK